MYGGGGEGDVCCMCARDKIGGMDGEARGAVLCVAVVSCRRCLRSPGCTRSRRRSSWPPSPSRSRTSAAPGARPPRRRRGSSGSGRRAPWRGTRRRGAPRCCGPFLLFVCFVCVGLLCWFWILDCDWLLDCDFCFSLPRSSLSQLSLPPSLSLHALLLTCAPGRG